MTGAQINPDYVYPRLEALTSWDADWADLAVVVVGLGLTGFSVADTLIELGARVVVVDAKDSPEYRAKAQTLTIVGACQVLLGQDAMQTLPQVQGQQPELLVTSPGIAPEVGILAQARQEKVQIWGDVELAWRLNRRQGRKSPQWLCVTGTNGKTTTVGMLESILRTAGYKALAVGNIGTPILDALRDPVDYDFFAVELSSFQLHWTRSVSALAAVVLNLAQDHVDWHQGYSNYLADKARIYQNTQVACIFNAGQPEIVAMVEEADVQEGCRAVGFWADSPDVSMLGLVEDLLVDRAFLDQRQTQALELATVADTAPIPSKHTVENALAAAGLARAAGIEPAAIKAGLQNFEPGAHRIQAVAHTRGVVWVNDSKATNPHAASASLAAFSSVIWIAGGLSKGVDYDQLLAQHAHRLKAVILIGSDSDKLAQACTRQAPDLKIYRTSDDLADAGDGAQAMRLAVAQAYELAASGDTVLLAPASASMDQFSSYADRGNRFIAEVTALVETLKD